MPRSSNGWVSRAGKRVRRSHFSESNGFHAPQLDFVGVSPLADLVPNLALQLAQLVIHERFTALSRDRRIHDGNWMPEPHEVRSIIENAEQAAAAGNYSSAEELLREAAALQEQTLGPHHPDL